MKNQKAMGRKMEQMSGNFFEECRVSTEFLLVHCDDMETVKTFLKIRLM